MKQKLHGLCLPLRFFGNAAVTIKSDHRITKMVALITFMTLFYSLGNGQINPDSNAIIKTNRPDNRYLSTRGVIQQHMRDLDPILSFSPHLSKKAFETWQVEVRNKMKDLMGFPVVSAQPEPKLVSKIQRDGYVVQKWEIYPMHAGVVPILILIPDNISTTNPAPAVICYPGSNRSKEELAGEPELNPKFKIERNYGKNHMAKAYVQQGIIAVAIDNPGIAEVSDLEFATSAPNYHRATFSRFLIDMGWHYVGYSAFNGQQVLNWLKTLSFVDKNRIALSGHSLGTEAVMMLAVLNPDIEAVVFNDFITNVIRRATASTRPSGQGSRPVANELTHCVPGLWRWFDYVDLLASLAPMKLLITEGGVTEDLQTIQKAYEIAGSVSDFKYVYYKKFENPVDRIGDEGIPEGVDSAGYLAYANVDVPNHYFKADIAVPWLSKVFFRKTD